MHVNNHYIIITILRMSNRVRVSQIFSLNLIPAELEPSLRI